MAVHTHQTRQTAEDEQITEDDKFDIWCLDKRLSHLVDYNFFYYYTMKTKVGKTNWERQPQRKLQINDPALYQGISDNDH